MLEHTREQEEAKRAGNQPEQSQQNRDTGHDFGVDPSGLRPGVDGVQFVEVMSDNTSDDLHCQLLLSLKSNL